jgi:uncharacterized protein YraI
VRRVADLSALARSCAAAGIITLAVFFSAGGAAAQSASDMVDACTRTGQSYFRDYRSPVDVRYQGVRIAGAHLVNGRIWLPSRAESFTCTFTPNGRQMILFFAEGRLQPGFVPTPPPQPPAAPVPPPTGQLVQVTGVAPNDVLNVRSGPGTSYQVIGALGNGTTVRRLGCRSVGTARWCEIQQLTDMRERGWVNARFLGEPGVAAPQPPASQLPERPGAGVTVQVTGLQPGGRLNLRTGPGTSYPVSGSLSNGTSVRRLSCESLAGTRWCQVELLTPGRQRGWVSGRYLTDGAASQLPGDTALPGTGVSATGRIPCTDRASTALSDCPFAVSRHGRGTATLRVTLPSGAIRRIDFQRGIPTASDGTGYLGYTRYGDTIDVRIGASERYQVFDAVVFGG